MKKILSHCVSELANSNIHKKSVTFNQSELFFLRAAFFPDDNSAGSLVYTLQNLIQNNYRVFIQGSVANGNKHVKLINDVDILIVSTKRNIEFVYSFDQNIFQSNKLYNVKDNAELVCFSVNKDSINSSIDVGYQQMKNTKYCIPTILEKKFKGESIVELNKTFFDDLYNYKYFILNKYTLSGVNGVIDLNPKKMNEMFVFRILLRLISGDCLANHIDISESIMKFKEVVKNEFVDFGMQRFYTYFNKKEFEYFFSLFPSCSNVRLNIRSEMRTVLQEINQVSRIDNSELMSLLNKNPTIKLFQIFSKQVLGKPKEKSKDFVRLCSEQYEYCYQFNINKGYLEHKLFKQDRYISFLHNKLQQKDHEGQINKQLSLQYHETNAMLQEELMGQKLLYKKINNKYQEIDEELEKKNSDFKIVRNAEKEQYKIVVDLRKKINSLLQENKELTNKNQIYLTKLKQFEGKNREIQHQLTVSEEKLKKSVVQVEQSFGKNEELTQSILEQKKEVRELRKKEKELELKKKELEKLKKKTEQLLVQKANHHKKLVNEIEEYKERYEKNIKITQENKENEHGFKEKYLKLKQIYENSLKENEFNSEKKMLLENKVSLLTKQEEKLKFNLLKSEKKIEEGVLITKYLLKEKQYTDTVCLNPIKTYFFPYLADPNRFSNHFMLLDSREIIKIVKNIKDKLKTGIYLDFNDMNSFINLSVLHSCLSELLRFKDVGEILNVLKYLIQTKKETFLVTLDVDLIKNDNVWQHVLSEEPISNCEEFEDFVTKLSNYYSLVATELNELNTYFDYTVNKSNIYHNNSLIQKTQVLLDFIDELYGEECEHIMQMAPKVNDLATSKFNVLKKQKLQERSLVLSVLMISIVIKCTFDIGSQYLTMVFLMVGLKKFKFADPLLPIFKSKHQKTFSNKVEEFRSANKAEQYPCLRNAFKSLVDEISKL